LIGGGPKAIEIKRRGDAGHQNHRAVQRGGVAEGGERTEDAVAADQCDLNVLSLGEFYDQGDYANDDKNPLGERGKESKEVSCLTGAQPVSGAASFMHAVRRRG